MGARFLSEMKGLKRAKTYDRKQESCLTTDVSDSVVLDLVNVALGKIKEIVKDQKNIKKAVSIDRKGGEKSVSVTVNVKLYLTKSIKETAETIQKTIKEEVEGMTGLISVENIMINVLDVEVPERSGSTEELIPDEILGNKKSDGDESDGEKE